MAEKLPIQAFQAIEIETLINSGESERLEFKTSFGRDAMETLSAFSNSNGGTVLVGINDKGKIMGVQITQESILETDFFARHPITNDVKLIQACWQMTDQKPFDREYRGLQSAMKDLSIHSDTIATWDDEAQMDNNINVVPIWKWLLDDQSN